MTDHDQLTQSIDTSASELRRGGGKSGRRRFRSSCIHGLQVFIDLLQVLLRHSSPSDTREVTQDRLDTAIDYGQCIIGRVWEPARGEPLLERYNGEVPVDSPVAESVRATDSEGENELSGVWAEDRVPQNNLSEVRVPHPIVRITRKDPLLRQRRSVGSVSYPISGEALFTKGVEIEPATQTEKFRSSVVVSIAWRQVLDTVWTWGQNGRKETLRPFSYHAGVLSAFSHGSAAGCSNAEIVTCEKRGVGGKLWVSRRSLSH